MPVLAMPPGVTRTTETPKYKETGDFDAYYHIGDIIDYIIKFDKERTRDGRGFDVFSGPGAVFMNELQRENYKPVFKFDILNDPIHENLTVEAGFYNILDLTLRQQDGVEPPHTTPPTQNRKTIAKQTLDM